MTDLNLMETKEPTWAVIPAVFIQSIEGGITISTVPFPDNIWEIAIDAGNHSINLTGPQAAEVLRFIDAHVRKRW